MVAEVVFFFGAVGDAETIDVFAFAADFESVAEVAGIDDFDVTLT